MKMSMLVFALLFSALFVSCRLSTRAELFVSEINSKGGLYHDTISLVKDPTKVNNQIVVWDSIDSKFYVVKLYGNRHLFAADEDAYAYYLANRQEVVPAGHGYYSGSDGKLYEVTENTSKDLEKAQALIDGVQINRMAEQVVAEFGLSEERGQTVANVLFQFGRIQRNRSLTQDDLKNLGKELVGSDLHEFESALSARAQGDSASFDSLINKAAEFNHVSPEQMQAIVETLVK
ncbi:MAG: hypothetical protein HYV97_08520 [Bdellovibrio sp.]|nr:hypothetical protein [Bdellovibrio sp.]